ncbi:MAG: c-type cytochrome [Silicimonas sp.]|nr:c-type cytochrome [Silicimonas sp.]
MLDTMTFTKVIGGLCGTFLIFLLGGFAAEFIYHAPKHHGDDHHQAYVIDTGADEGAAEEVEVAFADVFAAADASKGEKLFRQCKACHALDAGKNGTGPSLYGVVDRAVGTEAGFGYSGKLVAVADAWTPENLNAFIENPKGFAPGTKMSYKGMKKIEDRANLIAWLQTIGQ